MCGFLDDDDLLFADHVETLVRALDNAAGQYRAACSLGYEVPTRLLTRTPFRYEEGSYRRTFRPPFDRRILAEWNLFPINAVLFDRDLFREEGGFDPALDLLEDWDLWFRYARRTDYLYVNRPTFLFRVPLDREVATRRHAELLNYGHHFRAKHAIR